MEQRWLRLPRVGPRKGTTFDTCMRFHLKGPLQTKSSPYSPPYCLFHRHTTPQLLTLDRRDIADLPETSQLLPWKSAGMIIRRIVWRMTVVESTTASASKRTHTHSAVLAAFRSTNYRELAFPACPGNKLNEDGFLARSCQVSRSRLMEAHSTRQGRFTSFGQKHHHHLTTSPNLPTIEQTNLPPCFMTSGGCITSDAYLPIGVMHPTG